MVLLAAACETFVAPQVLPSPDVPSAGKFPHARLGILLDKIVSSDGLVDYAALSVERSLLEEYLAEAARVSPDSHPHLFPTEEDRLAYWINVHNACALRAVLHWNRPATLASIGGRFDTETKFPVGRARLSLAGITSLIRKRFADPRVHFALVRGRRGGPPLAKAPYEPATLDASLEKAARAFVADPRNVDFRPPSTQLRVSRLFLDYRGDFELLEPATVSGDLRLITAIDRWRASDQKIVATTVVPIPFDERLNDVANR